MSGKEEGATNSLMQMPEDIPQSDKLLCMQALPYEARCVPPGTQNC